ncbi:hypothetical protein MTAB308_4815 [Mycobacterium terramassiliense]|uniref:Uncharacterized protein n=2 Tax=Mycobacterium terramassiliense TaxID=1841859 RepID=A0A2U3NIF7_9MYCO|nr:hypothetical protein MTAB308_4815 [Mycobacterium terramassiliense]
MATWRPGDLNVVAKHHPAPTAAGTPFAYGIPDCSESGEFDTSGCPIRVARVVYRGADFNIYELALVNGQWECNNLLVAAGTDSAEGLPAQAVSDPTAYVGIWNNPGVGAVNYADEFGNIFQLLLTGLGWSYINITNWFTTPPATPAAGNVFGYWDFYNDIDRLIYRGLHNDTQIYEISDQNGNYICSNLSTNDKSEKPAPPAGGNPFGYCYGDVPRVIYRGADGHVYELHPQPYWKCSDLLEASGGAPRAASDPYAYVPDIARVIYADTDRQIIELSLEGNWKWANLSTNDKTASAPAPAAAGNPFGYQTSDGVLRVIYRGFDGHIYELRSDPSTMHVWKWADLSTIDKTAKPAQQAAGDPFGYEIVDNIPRVVYLGTNGHICELALY